MTTTCSTCGYKLTLLLTSSVCDKCDGLLPPAVDKTCEAGTSPNWVPFQDWSDLKPGRTAKFVRPNCKSMYGCIDWSTPDAATITWASVTGMVTYFAERNQVELFRECLLLLQL